MSDLIRKPARDQLYRLFDAHPEGVTRLLLAVTEGRIDGKDSRGYFVEGKLCGCVFAHVFTGTSEERWHLVGKAREELGVGWSSLCAFEDEIEDVVPGQLPDSQPDLAWLGRSIMGWLSTHGPLA